MGLTGAPGATTTAQRGTWADRRPPVVASTRSGIAGPVYLGSPADTPAAGTPQSVDPKQGSGPTPTRGPLVEADIIGESLLYRRIPGPLWQRIRKWVKNDEASGAFIPPTGYSQTLDKTVDNGRQSVPAPIPVDEWISELLYRVWVRSASQRFEDLENGAEAAKIIPDGEVAGSLTPHRPATSPAHWNRLTGATLLPTSPTLSRYQEVLGTGDLEGSTLY